MAWAQCTRPWEGGRPVPWPQLFGAGTAHCTGLSRTRPARDQVRAPGLGSVRMGLSEPAPGCLAGSWGEAGPAGSDQWAGQSLASCVGFPPSCPVPPAGPVDAAPAIASCACPAGLTAAQPAHGTSAQPLWSCVGTGCPSPGRLPSPGCLSGRWLLVPRSDPIRARTVIYSAANRSCSVRGSQPTPTTALVPSVFSSGAFSYINDPCWQSEGQGGCGGGWGAALMAFEPVAWPPFSLGRASFVQDVLANRRATLGATCPSTCLLAVLKYTCLEMEVKAQGCALSRLCPNPFSRHRPRPHCRPVQALPPLPCPGPFPVAVWREAFKTHPLHPSCPL